MATDRELLVLAAKAAGIEVVRSRLDDPMNCDFLIVGSVRNHEQRNGPWNPLTDDGDALRLAAKLGIKSRYNSALGQGLAWSMTGHEYQANMEDCGRDECAALRRAIVHAAARLERAATTEPKE